MFLQTRGASLTLHVSGPGLSYKVTGNLWNTPVKELKGEFGISRPHTSLALNICILRFSSFGKENSEADKIHACNQNPPHKISSSHTSLPVSFTDIQQTQCAV